MFFVAKVTDVSDEGLTVINESHTVGSFIEALNLLRRAKQWSPAYRILRETSDTVVVYEGY